MSYTHAVVWIDHHSAVVIAFALERDHITHVASQREDTRIHRKSGLPGSGHATDDVAFFDEVASVVLADGGNLLVVGPGTAKRAFVRHLSTRHPRLADRVVGVETVDHPSDGELLAFARRYFKRLDALGA